jgi:hypothetical protein
MAVGASAIAQKLTRDVLSKSRVIAKGSDIDAVDRLVKKYGGKTREWAKKSTQEMEIDGRPAEIHWYERKGAALRRKSEVFGWITNAMRVRVRHDPSCAEYQDLTPGNMYHVIGIEADDLRVMSDEGRPYLYPSELFEIVDPNDSLDWQTTFGEDGERYSYPPEMNVPGFFERHFDGDKKTAHILRMYMQRLSGRAPPGT